MEIIRKNANHLLLGATRSIAGAAILAAVISAVRLFVAAASANGYWAVALFAAALMTLSLAAACLWLFGGGRINNKKENVR